MTNVVNCSAGRDKRSEALAIVPLAQAAAGGEPAAVEAFKAACTPALLLSMAWLIRWHVPEQG